MLYLENKGFLSQALTPNLVRQYALAKFAARYWHYHYQQADSKSTEHLAAKAITLLTTPSTLDRWIRLYDIEVPFSTSVSYTVSAQTHPSPMYYAALLGLEDVLTGILSDFSRDINVQGGHYGNALQAASHSGHERAVQILLDHGAMLMLKEESMVMHRRRHQIMVTRGWYSYYLTGALMSMLKEDPSVMPYMRH